MLAKNDFLEKLFFLSVLISDYSHLMSLVKEKSIKNKKKKSNQYNA